MTKKEKFAKTWLYFRTGYSYYFVFLVSGLNALMIAYFVVILGTTCESGKSLTEDGDILCLIRYLFPHFGLFVLFTVAVGLPALVAIGRWHYTRNQYGTHAYVEWETNPTLYKLVGHDQLTFELFKELLEEIKERNKFNPEKLKRLNSLEEKVDHLLIDETSDDCRHIRQALKKLYGNRIDKMWNETLKERIDNFSAVTGFKIPYELQKELAS